MAELPVFDIPDATEKIMGPLKFEENDTEQENFTLHKSNAIITPCLLCDETFDFGVEQDLFLGHLFKEHHLVIADVQVIADLSGYVKYWKHRLLTNNVEEFCTTMLLDQTPDGTCAKDEKYYLLSDITKEDKTLRQELQQKRLELVLTQQTIERNDNEFCRECWFCHMNYTGSRTGFFTHLSEAHNVQIGRPNNLVFTTELLDTIEDKLNRLQCVYCDKTFKERSILKEHMRKKLHKRINPDNKSFDKYYLINYLEMGKTWQSLQREKKTSNNFERNRTTQCSENVDVNTNHNDAEKDNSDEESDSDWSGWNEQYVSHVFCLFCEHAEENYDTILEHMQDVHRFNFIENTIDFTFYDKLRLVNYIRRQIYLRNCITCCINFDTKENLFKHMSASKHYELPDRSKWNQVEYFFPTYEDDAFLCSLDDLNDTDE